MAVRSSFFNSINGDRVYHTGHWAEYFASFIGNGIFPNPSSNLQTVSNDDMTVTIKAGSAWINGYILISDSDYNLDITPADGALNRIDRIVVRYDSIDREVRLEVKQGNFATNPVAPELQRNADAYELAIADVSVNAGAVSVTQANITDTRLNKELCGIVHGVVEQVDTTTIFNQYQSWINQEKARFESDVDGWLANEQLGFETWEQQQKSEFDTWFASIQDILDGNAAANLQAQILGIRSDLDNIDAPSTQEFNNHLSDETAHGVGDKSSLKTAEKDTIVGAMNELFTNVSNGKSLVGGAITGVDENVVIPTEPTFEDLADAIGGISTGKKFATGTSYLEQVSSRRVRLIVSGLDFRPDKVFALGDVTARYGTHNVYPANPATLTYRYAVVNEELRPTSQMGIYATSQTSAGYGTVSVSCTVSYTGDGFVVTINGNGDLTVLPNSEQQWFAYG